jgi:hypothetical protein
MTMQSAPFPAFKSTPQARESHYPEAAFRAAIDVENSSGSIYLQRYRHDVSAVGHVSQEQA